MTVRSIQEDLAAYGARLGIVEPLLRRCTGQIPELLAVIDDLRARGDYQASDRLRSVARVLADVRDYAFPQPPPR